MSRIRWFYHLTGTVFLALVICLWMPQHRPAFAATMFSDIKGHWAEQSILEMSACGVVHGYPGGLFKPGEDIEFQQAIVMIINALGWGEEAAKANLTGLTFPAQVTWTKGYLALAVEKGMLTKEGLPGLNPKRPATRLEVASLLCLALGFEPDYSPLNFQDAEKINKNYRGYVGAIVKRGIMIGLPGNIFAPEMTITRAQICTMLSRLIEQSWITPPPPWKRLVGRITGLDEGEGSITVRDLGGEKIIHLLEDCLLFDGKKMIERSSLKKNKRILLIINHEAKASFGCLLSDFEPAVRTAEGFLVSLQEGARGYTLTLETETKEKLQFDLYSDAHLEKGSEELTAADLKLDSFVSVSLDKNDKAFAGEVFEPEKINGIFIALSSNELTIKRRGVEQKYLVSKNVRVTRNTIRPFSLFDLRSGDYLSILVLNDLVFQIDYLSNVDAGLSGMVSKVRGNSIYIYIWNEEKRYDLDEQIEIFKDSQHQELDDLKRGDYINFALADNQKVISIEILDEKEGEFTGTILYLGTAEQPFLALRTAGGLELEYEIKRDASMFRYGDKINLEDIVPGAKVRIKVDEGKVSKIEVMDDQNITVEGRVVNINKEKDRLTLEISGRKYSYSLSFDLTVFDQNGKIIDLSSVIDYRIEAKLKDGRIIEITVKSG